MKFDSPTSSVHEERMDKDGIESGYVSAQESDAVPVKPATAPTLPLISLTKSHLDFLNEQMESMHPIDILRFCTILFPNLYQSTAFGLTGLVTLDMLSKIQQEQAGEKKTKKGPSGSGVDLIFLDTLYHFNETYELVDRVRARYPGTRIHVFQPEGASSAAELESIYGEAFYHTAGELYDYVVKVEPLERAYRTLGVGAVLSGRRRSQGAARGSLPIIEIVDDGRRGGGGGLVKINPLATWSFAQVRAYVRDNDLPYNALLDHGYTSVGDWHSTEPVVDGEDERAGRWRGQAKTECGIHNERSRYARFLKEAEASQQQIPV